MGFKDKILKQLMTLGETPMTIKEIENKLNFRSSMERKVLSSAIRDLLEDGSLIELGRGKIVAASEKNLIKGELRGNKRGFAFLIREDKGPDLFVPNRSLGSAMHGDTVLAKKVGESEGSVVSVVKRGVLKLVGTYIRSGKFGFVVPDNDSFFKDIFIPYDNTHGAAPLSKVVVTITIDPSNSKPVGDIIEVIGQAGERDAEVLSILKNYDFNDKFPEDVLKASEDITYSPDYNRKDMKKLLTITIDGEDAKDFDDAISIEKTEKGYRLYVHIADVSNYVKTGGIIDKEALSRATSVYFPGSVFPMLPEAISNGVCSLRPEEDKLTLTAIMDIDKSGKVVNTEFYETTTCSDYRMTYTNVTKILEGDSELILKYKKIVPMLQDAKELAEILTAKRNKRGAINFVTRESKITLDDKGEVSDIKPYPYEVSNGIIEQFMILANESVAEYLSKKTLPCIYRVHEIPSYAKLEAFTQFINGFGYKLDVKDGVTPKIFSDLLVEIKGDPAEPIINKVMLRSMQKARYSTANIGHFGLSSEFYCHFTSPIRRYPDLMVHRLLKAAINNKTDEKFVSKYRALCDAAANQSSEREVAAERSERDIDDYYKALYMTKHIGEQFEGIISGVISAGIFVELKNTVEGFIPEMELPEDRYEIDEKNYRLMGISYAFAIGDIVKVEIKSAVIETRSVNMTLISDVKNHLRKTRKGNKTV